jgi:hypothetical protein
MTGELAEPAVEISPRDLAAAVLAPRIGTSATTMTQFNTRVAETDKMRRKMAEMRIEVEAAKGHTNRHVNTWGYLKAIIRPAVTGDLGARERLRTVLAKVEYWVEGMANGGLCVRAGSQSITSDPRD